MGDIHSATGKLRRAVLQFTPVSWLYVRWLDPNSTTMRILAVWILILAWQMVELNTFFLKHIFFLQPSHMLNLVRLLLICLISAPTIRQYYVYVTDTRCKRVGTQLWVFCAIMLTESIICIKFGLQMFRQTVVSYIFIWLCIQMVGSFVCIYLCAWFAERWNKWKHLGEYADSPIRSLKTSPTNSPSSSPPYETATLAGDSLPSEKVMSDSAEQDDDDILIISTANKNINQSKHQNKREKPKGSWGDASKVGDRDLQAMIPQTKHSTSKSSNSRRRRKQAVDSDGDGEERMGNSGGGGGGGGRGTRLGNQRTERNFGAEDSNHRGESEPEEPDISAQVESLMTGQLLVNGYHHKPSVSPNKKRSSVNKQGQNSTSTKPSTRAKPSGK
ncbi:hypothetical protein EGW08_004733 [Elysia chlorotica]|uniref:Phosphatidylserine synthase n=1 Tax=Elysia chlorotica TaxID=188477 RepID=A0A3S1CAJ4_ELYCH|nr:hypothetical protein EGW08_004733 [Elysia chlorotica]